MPHAEQSIELAAAALRLWDFVVVPRLWPHWLILVDSVHGMSPAHVAAGTRFELLRRGERRPDHWIVADWEPQRHVRFTDFDRDIQLRFEVQPNGERAVLDASLQWQPQHGILDQLIPSSSVGGRWARSLGPSLRRLKELVDLNRDIRLLYGTGEEPW